MGTVVKSVGFYKPFFREGIVSMTTRASKRCLRNSGTGIENTGMLINTAVYTENHLSEPALAALIQSALEKNTRETLLAKGNDRKLFSFDLHNGSGGVINAMQIMDGFIHSGQIKNGLIIAGDTRPRSGEAIHYHYENNAGAVLLSDDPSKRGFVRFKSETYPDFENDFQSIIHWNSGRLKLEILQKDSFLGNCTGCAANSILQFLNDENLQPEDIDLVLTSQTPSRFAPDLQNMLKWKNKLMVNGGNREIYSAGLLFSMQRAFSNGKFRDAGTILFVTVGAGITVSLSLYLNH